MNKIKYGILTLILIIFLINIDIVISSTKSASIIFFNKVFISIFPFIILSDILIYFNYHIFLKNTIGKIISKIFNIDSNSTIVFILSILTSQPANAVYIKDLLDNNIIDINEANKILCFTYFPSISFVIATIGLSLYKSYKIGIIIYLFCLLNNILIGLYLRKEKTINTLYISQNKKDFFSMIKSSILKGINTSIIILGNLIIFTIIINLIIKYININPILLSIFSSLIELTTGLINISNLNISLSYQIILTIFILDFSSLSILFQSFSILSNYKINKKRILLLKLVFSIFTLIIILFINCIISYFINSIFIMV